MEVKAEVHTRILRDLSNEGLTVVVQEAVLSSIGALLPVTPCFTSLPSKVNEAVHALLSLTQLMSQGDTYFEAAFQRSRTALKRLAAESLGGVDGFVRREEVTAALSYIRCLARFRALWVFLFGAAYSRSSQKFAPPHMFAVRWSEVLCDSTLGWFSEIQEEAKRTFASIQGGNTSLFAYFLFVLQHALSIRMILVECVAEMMLNSSVHFDVMAVVRNMYMASEALNEVAELQSIWRQEGLLPDALREKCLLYQFSSDNICHSLWVHSGLDPVLSLTEKRARIFVLCPFFWILQHLVWDLYGRLTLFFQSCFIAMPFEGLFHYPLKDAGGAGAAISDELQPVVGRNISHTNCSFERRQENRVDLAVNSAATDVVSFLRRRVTTSASSASLDPTSTGLKSQSSCVSPSRGDSVTRLVENESLEAYHKEFLLPFDLNFACTEVNESGFLDSIGSHILAEALWNLICERPRTTFFVITDCTRRPGARAWQRNRCTVTTCMDDAAGRQGMEHWVLNFVCPSARLSENAMKRAQQESMLLWAVVFQVAGSPQRRTRFTNDGSVFYVVRSDNEMDGGRMYFVLLLQHGVSTTHPHGGVRDKSAREVSGEESRWAFRSLEEVCAAWSMPQLCNLAVRLAVGLA
ncbi:hypothetical protein TraAM80_04264 [Trypanosoma rangeli]|uniref:Uncharacterized protein n=1 Tax=Trypanosoma rangeli TaxID=5698 RepID=A0A3R7NPY4_TRYRA|nr:uncharacterized protein TraAM80_04264 [Trypanosoma rangeli]RNF05885.1 hypothetical protein TraAM80_04264 [Trypanosoma rangeli]|eukprot:RNF05885.1 hypothetical protein TraAM80_04264 [Trypanosoma rangeli]